MIEIATREEVKRMIDEQGTYVLIDVRFPEELNHGMLPTAKNIPLPELPEALEMDEETFKKTYSFSKPTKEEVIVFYCRSGGRAHEAADIAIRAGYKNVKNYAGSILDWADIDPNVHRY